jgi:hypothetical protein
MQAVRRSLPAFVHLADEKARANERGEAQHIVRRSCAEAPFKITESLSEICAKDDRDENPTPASTQPAISMETM